jgi:hypothetical protein
VVLDIIAVFIYLLAPSHDFHTSWMNMTYNENQQVFETEWRTDTEHFEAVLSKRGNIEYHLYDTSEVDFLIQLYISENLNLRLNNKHKRLHVSYLEVNFNETIVHFKPIKYRCKLKNVLLKNTLLVDQFPGQSNMFQLNYLGKSYSMLFNREKKEEYIEINSM